jgi:hypothetical protein
MLSKNSPDPSDRRREHRRLREIFAVCDALERNAERLDAEAFDGDIEGVEKRRAELLAEFEGLMAPALPALLLQALRGDAPKELDPEDLLLAMILINRRIRDGEIGISGRELLWTVHSNAFDVFSSIHRLASKGALCRAGLLHSWAEEEGADALDRIHVLAPEAWSRLMGTEGAEELTPRPFVDDCDLFLATRDLVGAHQRRAAAIFPNGVWREIHGEPEEEIPDLELEIEARRREISQRLAITPEARDFELLRFRRHHALGGAEMLVVAALLAQEALQGSPQIDTLDLLRLVSSSERELLRRRSLFSARGALLRQGILVLEDGPGSKSLNGTASLADWVVEGLLDARLRSGRSIASDERIEFHRYLDGLEGSEDFFRKLD